MGHTFPRFCGVSRAGIFKNVTFSKWSKCRKETQPQGDKCAFLHSEAKSIIKKDQISVFLRRKNDQKRGKSLTKKDQNVAFCIFPLKCKFLHFSRKSLTQKDQNGAFLLTKKIKIPHIAEHEIQVWWYQDCWQCAQNLLTVCTQISDGVHQVCWQFLVSKIIFLHLMMVCIKFPDWQSRYAIDFALRLNKLTAMEIFMS